MVSEGQQIPNKSYFLTTIYGVFLQNSWIIQILERINNESDTFQPEPKP